MKGEFLLVNTSGSDEESASVRALLVRTAKEKGKTLKQLSMLLGRNPAYLQQFVARGVPRDLPFETAVSLSERLDLPVDNLLSGETRQTFERLRKEASHPEFVNIRVEDEDRKNRLKEAMDILPHSEFIRLIYSNKVQWLPHVTPEAILAVENFNIEKYSSAWGIPNHVNFAKSEIDAMVWSVITEIFDHENEPELRYGDFAVVFYNPKITVPGYYLLDDRNTPIIKRVEPIIGSEPRLARVFGTARPQLAIETPIDDLVPRGRIIAVMKHL